MQDPHWPQNSVLDEALARKVSLAETTATRPRTPSSTDPVGLVVIQPGPEVTHEDWLRLATAQNVSRTF